MGTWFIKIKTIYGIEVNIDIIEGVPANGACIIDVDIPVLDEYYVDSYLITTSKFRILPSSF